MEFEQGGDLDDAAHVQSHPASGVVRRALRVRADGDLDRAVALIREKADLTDPKTELIYFRLLHELQDGPGLQIALGHAIDRVGQLPANVPNEYLTTLIRFAQRACLPLEPLNRLLKAVVPIARRRPDVLQAANALRFRQRFKTDLAQEFRGGATLLSLGLHCLPWSLPMLWGFRSAGQYRSNTTPFALAGHRIETLISTLETDFEDYCEPSSVMVVETPRGHRLAMRNDRGCHWNHNRGTYWLKEDLGRLRENIGDKVEAFRLSARRNDAVFLLAKVENEYPDEPLDFLPALQAALARYTGTDRNHILISNQTAEGKAASFHVVDDKVSFFYCPYPSPDYVWHHEETEDSRVGLLYERQYANFILMALARWKLLRRRSEREV